MKKAILPILLVIAAGIYWYTAGIRTAQKEVRAFYAEQIEAEKNRDSDRLCEMADEGLLVHDTTTENQDKPESTTLHKREYCKDIVEGIDSVREFEKEVGGKQQEDFQYTLTSVSIGRDRKSAKVSVSSIYALSGSVVVSQSESQETLVRRDGRWYLTGIDRKVQIDYAQEEEEEKPEKAEAPAQAPKEGEAAKAEEAPRAAQPVQATEPPKAEK